MIETKKVTVIKEEEVVICDACGAEITNHNRGYFSVTEYYNNAPYRKQGMEVVGYETGSYLNNFGDFCLKCTTRMHEAFLEAMEKAGFIERYALNNESPTAHSKVCSTAKAEE